MTINERIEAFSTLGNWIVDKKETLEQTVQQTYYHNRWFSVDNVWKSLEAISSSYIDKNKLEDWAKAEAISDPKEVKKVGLVLAGNLPLVGFHDWLSVLIAGHDAVVKLSDKDKFALPKLNEWLCEIEPRFVERTTFVERLENYEVVIATGSDNSARYFEQYFGKYPNIIRKNRNGVGVISGSESDAELESLGKDIFDYYGLGCRSVAKLYVPEDYDFDRLFTNWKSFEPIIHHNKYKNNFDYNYTLLIMNKEKHKSNGFILLEEREEYTSRIASLNYEYYSDKRVLEKKLEEEKNKIQCIVSSDNFLAQPTKSFGQAQSPGLMDYADGVNTIQFLKQF